MSSFSLPWSQFTCLAVVLNQRIVSVFQSLCCVKLNRLTSNFKAHCAGLTTTMKVGVFKAFISILLASLFSAFFFLHDLCATIEADVILFLNHGWGCRPLVFCKILIVSAVAWSGPDGKRFIPVMAALQ